ncbi:hypothetical protein ZWY2020_046586 [Hordeum vulgare]|nr:hypothetical protein ZWY2020_046586 [Hordeum vulgare]
MEIARSLPPGERPHAVMIPYPAQGHVTPMLKLAKLLHARGFHVTFVNNEFNHRRLLRSQSADTLRALPAFRFAAIADGLPPSDREATQDIPALCYSTMTTCLPRFKELVLKLNEEAEASGGALPPVTCVVADSVMSFGLRAARELGLRCATLWTASACGFMGYNHYKDLLDRGIFPLKEEAQLSNGYLDMTIIDWMPGMPQDMRLRDLPTFLRATDPDDIISELAYLGLWGQIPIRSKISAGVAYCPSGNFRTAASTTPPPRRRRRRPLRPSALRPQRPRPLPDPRLPPPATGEHGRRRIEPPVRRIEAPSPGAGRPILGAGDSPSASPTSSTPPGPPPRLQDLHPASAGSGELTRRQARAAADDLTAAAGGAACGRVRLPEVLTASLPTSPTAAVSPTPSPAQIAAAARKVFVGLLARWFGLRMN